MKIFRIWIENETRKWWERKVRSHKKVVRDENFFHLNSQDCFSIFWWSRELKFWVLISLNHYLKFYNWILVVCRCCSRFHFFWKPFNCSKKSICQNLPNVFLKNVSSVQKTCQNSFNSLFHQKNAQMSLRFFASCLTIEF